MLTDVGDVAGDLFRTQLGVARFDLELLDVHGGVVILAHKFFRDEDRVLKVVAAPRHEADQHVTSEAKLAMLCAGTVGDNLPLHYTVALTDDRLLIDAGVLVRPLELDELIDIRTNLTRKLRGVVLSFNADDDALGVDRIDEAIAAGEDDGSRIASGNAFHAGADEWGFGNQQGHGLALHVGSHQGAVGVVMLEERHERCGDRNELFGAHVNVVNFRAIHENEVALPASVDQLLGDVALLVEIDVRLRDGVTILFTRRQIEGEGLMFDRALLFLPELLVELERLGPLEVIADAQTAFAGVGDLNEVQHAGSGYTAVGRLNEAVFVNARKARQRADEADVRTFRRLNRADAAIVRGVNVADFESGALTRQAARPKCGETALVRDLRERVGLIHELRKLRRAEELADRRHDRLGVDEVVRHGRRHFLVDAHLFLDGALHADEADAELVLHELTDRADATVAKVIDVVDDADVLAQLEQVADRGVEVFGSQGALVESGGILVLVKLDVELQTAYAREIILTRIEEHALEERRRGVQGRRITRTQLAIDFD